MSVVFITIGGNVALKDKDVLLAKGF
jgi:hypothetical protein